jgi:two-component system response regulator FixJ
VAVLPLGARCFNGVRDRTMSVQPCVLIVDDDSTTRVQVNDVAVAFGFVTQAHDSLDLLFEQDHFPPIGCAVVELRLVSIDSRVIRERLMQKEAFLPLIYVSDRPTIQNAVDVIRAGAESILEKPIDAAALGDEIRKAVEMSVLNRFAALRRNVLRQRLALLTPREQEVLDLVCLGKTSREIADDIKRSMKTVELHRTHILHKLGARSALELVRDLTKLEDENRTQS